MAVDPLITISLADITPDDPLSRYLLWQLAEATCVVDLMIKEKSAECGGAGCVVKVQMLHFSEPLLDRACDLFGRYP